MSGKWDRRGAGVGVEGAVSYRGIRARDAGLVSYPKMVLSIQALGE